MTGKPELSELYAPPLSPWERGDSVLRLLPNTFESGKFNLKRADIRQIPVNIERGQNEFYFESGACICPDPVFGNWWRVGAEDNGSRGEDQHPVLWFARKLHRLPLQTARWERIYLRQV